MCPENFVEEFPAKTRELVNWYYDSIKDNTGLEVIFLINCLLGLIVIIYEKHKDKLENIVVSHFSNSLPDSYKYLNGTSLKKREKRNYKCAKAKTFVKRLRDGIAHQHIEANSDDCNEWISVTIKDFSAKGTNKGRQNFEITLTIKQLKDLAIEISKLVN